MSFRDHLPDLLLHKRNIHYNGVNCVLGLSKSIQYSRVRFHIFYCNSAVLSNVVHYNRIFVMTGFIIAWCHCNWIYNKLGSSTVFSFNGRNARSRPYHLKKTSSQRSRNVVICISSGYIYESYQGMWTGITYLYQLLLLGCGSWHRKSLAHWLWWRGDLLPLMPTLWMFLDHLSRQT